MSNALSTTVAVIDFAAARDNMVDGQVRPNKVVDARIIRAMRRLPRERFLPAALASLAYVDEDVPLPGGRVLMEPMVIARLVQSLRVREGERGLVVASGAGYGAALLDACGAQVTAIEDDPALLALAGRVLPVVSPRVVQIDGPVGAGWASTGLYDFILIEGAVGGLPHSLGAQLKAEGRLATVIAQPGSLGQGVLGQGVVAEAVQVNGSLRLRAQPIFDCATPLLPQFQPVPGFIF